MPTPLAPMRQYPTELPPLRTARLWLRPVALTDQPDMERWCSDRALAENTLRIPHPYPPGAAAEFITAISAETAAGKGGCWAVLRRESGDLIGCMGLHIEQAFNHAELGYWIARPFWNQGYAAEAARAVVACGFQQFGLNRIHAHHFARNPASGRVLQKLGMKHEGTLRQHVFKWGEYLDAEFYGILRSEFIPDAP